MKTAIVAVPALVMGDANEFALLPATTTHVEPFSMRVLAHEDDGAAVRLCAGQSYAHASNGSSSQ